jgi:hypothetical protein
VNAVTSIGLHSEPAKEEYEARFVRAQRRRMAYAAIYILDKTLSTFTGRPPLLHQRYSDALPPFDLTDEEVLLLDPERETAMASLNFGGWNRFGRVCPTSFLRAQLLVARAREDVLEIMLGFPDNVDIDSVSYVPDSPLFPTIPKRLTPLKHSPPPHPRNLQLYPLHPPARSQRQYSHRPLAPRTAGITLPLLPRKQLSSL